MALAKATTYILESSHWRFPAPKDTHRHTDCFGKLKKSYSEKGDPEIQTRVGHAYAEYAVHADYAHMREYAGADADESLIHIIHI